MGETFIRVIDVETSTEDPETGQVIEVGWADIGQDLTVGAPVSFLVRPDGPISIEARAIHHISEEMAAAGISQEEAREAILANGPVAFVAHNAKFEQSFLPWIEAPWICTYKCALRLWPDAPRHSNQVLKYWLGIDLPDELAMPPHRAGPDAYVTAHIFAEMLRLEGDARLRRLAAWTRQPGLLPKVTFGKHKGANWADVPADYLHWIGTSEMNDDAKFTAAMELERRRGGGGA